MAALCCGTLVVVKAEVPTIPTTDTAHAARTLNRICDVEQFIAAVRILLSANHVTFRLTVRVLVL